MTHRRAVRQPVERLRRRVVELAEQALDVERQRRHPLAHLALPELARPVGVDLDPVQVGVAEIDRLADVVVGEPLQRRSARARRGRGSARGSAGRGRAARRGRGRCVRCPAERRAPRRAAAAARRPRARPCRRSRASTRRPIASLPVVERAVEVGDAQLDEPHARGGRDLHAATITRTELVGGQPSPCFRSASRCCASASVSAPSQTCAFSSFSIVSTSRARGYGSGQRLRGSVGLPPSSRLIRWSSW